MNMPIAGLLLEQPLFQPTLTTPQVSHLHLAHQRQQPNRQGWQKGPFKAHSGLGAVTSMSSQIWKSTGLSR